MTKYDDKMKKNTSQGRLQSTIRVFVILMSLVFLLNFVSAEEVFQFDNYKIYDAELQKVTVVNPLGFRNLADIKLNTPLEVVVPVGYQKVAEFTINSYDDSYTDALKNIEFQDIKSNYKIIERQFDYKLLTYESVYNKTSGNNEQVEKWVNFDSSKILKGEYTIGIFTEVFYGEKIEWIPEYYGVKINEWATWESYSAIINGLPDIGDNTNPAVFNISDKYFMIAGDYTPSIRGFHWSGTAWVGNSSVNASLPSVGNAPAPNIFYKDNSWFMLIGNVAGTFNGYVWNGNGWTINLTINSSLPDIGGWSSPSAFQIGSKWFMISGTQAGEQMGFSLADNSTTWLRNASINSTLTDIGGNTAPNVFYKDGDLYMLVGEFNSQGLNGYKWNGLNWETNFVINQSMTSLSATPCPSFFEKDLYYYLIVGLNDGTFAGFNSSKVLPPSPSVTLNSPTNYQNLTNPSVTFNVTATDEQKINNVTLYIDGLVNETNTSEVNGTYIFTKTLSEGSHNWSILAFNNNSLSNQSATREFWVNTAPSVTLDAPVNYANLTYNNIHFNTTVYSVYDIANVSFYLNGTLNETNTSGINGTYKFNKYLVDGYYNWSIVAMSSLGGYNQSATRTLTVDATAPSITIVYPLNTTYNTTLASENNISIWFNWTVSDINLDMCWWSNDSGATNNTISCNANSSEYWTYGQKSFIAWANDTLGNLGVARRTATWAYFSLVSATSYNAASYETRNETFYLNLTIGSMITKISPYLLYNGTYYAADSSCSGMLCQVSRKIDIPLLTSSSLDSENKSFLWQVTTFGDFGTSNENTTSYIQNVSGISFTNSGCVANYNASVNFTIYNETINTLMNAGFRGTFKYWLGDGTIKDSYNFTGEGKNHYLFCVDKNLSYLTDSEITVNATTNSRIYQFVKEIYSNSTKTQKLFIPDDAYTNTIIIEVKNQGLIPLANITVNISRYYPGIDKYEVVEHRTTDEFGQIITKIIQYDVKYKFRFYNSAGVLLKESDKVTIICRTAYCVVPFIIETTTDYLGRYDNLTSFSYELSFDNTSNIFTYSWIDQTGESAVHRLEVTRYQFNGSTTVCNSTSTSAVSSLNCSIGSQSATYTTQAFRKATGKNEIRISYLQAIVGDYSQTFGIEGLFWVFILLMVGIGIGIYNPSVGAIIYGTGFILMGILKIIYMPLPVFFANTLLCVLFIWAIKT